MKMGDDYGQHLLTFSLFPLRVVYLSIVIATTAYTEPGEEDLLYYLIYGNFSQVTQSRR